MEKKRGRPKKEIEERREKIIHIRFTKDEYDYIYYRSIREKCSMAEVIRKIIFR